MNAQIVLTSPKAAENIHIQCEPEMLIKLDFPYGQVTTHREGDDLVFFFPNEGSIALKDYFLVYEGAFPPFLLPDGEQLTVGELFTQHRTDLPPVKGSGGEDTLLSRDSLISGVERIGHLESATSRLESDPVLAWREEKDPHPFAWMTVSSLRLRETPLPPETGVVGPPEVGRPPDDGQGNELPGEEGGEPPVIEEPPLYAADFDDRFVLYLEPDPPAGFPFTITGRVQPSHPAAAPHPSYGSASEHGWGIVTVNPDGTVTYTLTDTSILESGENSVDYIHYIGADGYPQRIQVVINTSGDFDTSDSALDHTVNGETHVSYVPGQNARVTSSNGSDVLSFKDLAGSAASVVDINTGLGNDSITILPEHGFGEAVFCLFGDSSAAARITMNDGDNSLDIRATGTNNLWGIWQASATTGSGDDYISIDLSSTGNPSIPTYVEGIGSSNATDPAVVSMGNGNDTLRIIVNNDSTYSAAAGTEVATISMGDGDDSVYVHATSGYLAYGLLGAELDLGTGNDTLEVYANGGNSSNGISQSTVTHGGSAAAFINITAGGGSGTAASDSSITTGQADDTIRLTGTGQYNARGMSSTDIITGAGNDSVALVALGGSQAYGAYRGSIDLGSGRDTLSIIADAKQGTATGTQFVNISHNDPNFGAHITISATMQTTSNGWASAMSNGGITTGAGNDTITLAAMGGTGDNTQGTYWTVLETGAGNDSLSIIVQAGGFTYGTQDGRIDLGDGQDTLNISVTSTNNNVTGISGTQIIGGSGNAFITILADADAKGQAMQNASILLAEGNDSLSITVLGGTNDAYGVSGGTINLGSGQDTFSLIAQAGRQALGLSNVTLTHTGDAGANISIAATGGTRAQGVQSRSITTGDGNDTLAISATGTNTADAYARTGTTINTGGGDDLVTLTAVTARGTAVAANSGNVDLGDGNDTLRCEATTTGGTATAANYLTVNMGEGDNEAYFIARGGTATALGTVTVNSGGGNDLVHVEAAGSTSSVALASSTINLGAGNDTLALISGGITGQNTVNGGSGLDVLSLGNGLNITLGSGSGEINLQGVEFLDLGSDGGAGSTVSMTRAVWQAIWDGLESVTATDASNATVTVRGLFIKGDALDSVNFTDLNTTDWLASGDTVTYDGVTYTGYYLNPSDTALLFLQNGVGLL